ncbi:hypothetical protein [Streptomyces sp. NBC_00448]|uniref:hypothetical protein n=1 Tax=Streptomyces sp. NBC_00448 TaxID=2903652 RepID=UPI002E1EC388
MSKEKLNFRHLPLGQERQVTALSGRDERRPSASLRSQPPDDRRAGAAATEDAL